jgi:hypothetical protein
MVYSGYDAYDRGVKEGLFIKDIKGGYYLGQGNKYLNFLKI